MPVLQELDNKQIKEVLETACQKTVPSVITIRGDFSWMNLHSRILAQRGDHILMDIPPAENGQPPHEFVPAERMGISFKLKHHKHIFSATVVGQDRHLSEDGLEIPVLTKQALLSIMPA